VLGVSARAGVAAEPAKGMAPTTTTAAMAAAFRRISLTSGDEDEKENMVLHS
jgi:hypothetical protein